MTESKDNHQHIEAATGLDNNLISNDPIQDRTGKNITNNPTPIHAAVEPSAVEPSAGGNAYVIGQLGYDFGTETNKAIWEQRLSGNATDPAVMVAFLKVNPHDATELIWTLSQETVPIYAVHPFGAYASAVYDRIIQLFEEQINGNVERVAVAGVLGRSSRLLDGHIVGNLNVTTPRNIVGWDTAALASAALGASPPAALVAEFENFLQRIYHDLRNHGIADGSRALNYAATNATQAGSVFTQAFKDGMSLANVAANPSPIARPGTITYDVTMTFFNPSDRLNTAKKVYRLMVDVSETAPISVGQIRTWSEY